MIRHKSSTLLLAAGVALFAQGCARQTEETTSATPGSPVLATVAGEPISAADLLAEAERRRARRQPIPAKDLLLEAMVQRAAMVAKAKDSGIADDPEVRRSIDALLVRELRQRELNTTLDAITVTDEEVHTAYEAAATKYTQPPKARLAILRLTAGKTASEAKRNELRTQLENVRQKAISDHGTKGFGSLAIENSDDQVSRYKGGDAGWFESGVSSTGWPDAVVEAGHQLEAGSFSPVLESGGDFYLVTKTDQRASATTEFEKAAPSLRRRLLVEKREAAETAFLSQAQHLAQVEFHPESLAKIELKASPAARTADATPPSLPGLRSN